jgi:hypothetical protein
VHSFSLATALRVNGPVRGLPDSLIITQLEHCLARFVEVLELDSDVDEDEDEEGGNHCDRDGGGAGHEGQEEGGGESAFVRSSGDERPRSRLLTPRDERMLNQSLLLAAAVAGQGAGGNGTVQLCSFRDFVYQNIAHFLLVPGAAAAAVEFVYSALPQPRMVMFEAFGVLQSEAFDPANYGKQDGSGGGRGAGGCGGGCEATVAFVRLLGTVASTNAAIVAADCERKWKAGTAAQARDGGPRHIGVDTEDCEEGGALQPESQDEQDEEDLEAGHEAEDLQEHVFALQEESILTGYLSAYLPFLRALAAGDDRSMPVQLRVAALGSLGQFMRSSPELTQACVQPLLHPLLDGVAEDGLPDPDSAADATLLQVTAVGVWADVQGQMRTATQTVGLGKIHLILHSADADDDGGRGGKPGKSESNTHRRRKIISSDSDDDSDDSHDGDGDGNGRSSAAPAVAAHVGVPAVQKSHAPARRAAVTVLCALATQRQILPRMHELLHAAVDPDPEVARAARDFVAGWLGDHPKEAGRILCVRSGPCRMCCDGGCVLEVRSHPKCAGVG